MFACLVGWLVGCLFGWLVSCLFVWLVVLVVCLLGWLVGWLVVCLVGWLVVRAGGWVGRWMLGMTSTSALMQKGVTKNCLLQESMDSLSPCLVVWLFMVFGLVYRETKGNRSFKEVPFRIATRTATSQDASTRTRCKMKQEFLGVLTITTHQHVVRFGGMV